MALRHGFPEFDASCVARDTGRQLPVFPKAPLVEFRPRTDKQAVVAEVLSHRTVRVTAAPGAGKSVKLPGMIQQVNGGLVLHAVPSPFLADDLYEYVSTQVKHCKVTLLETMQQPMPTSGLVFLSNAHLLLRLSAWNVGGGVPQVPITVFLDEIHESDGVSEPLRNAAQAFSFVDYVVQASATFDPSGGRKREPLGHVQDCTYPMEEPSEWDLDDPTKPWCPSNFTGHGLIFVEGAADVEYLTREYNTRDIPVYVLSSRMRMCDYRQARSVIRNPHLGMCIFLADYGFRSGHSYNEMQMIIDTLQVPVASYDGEFTRKLIRPAYKFEHVQASTRAGRSVGSSCVVYRPDINLEEMITDLEGVEVHAAALMYRFMGYKPPHRFRGTTPYFSGKVPRDLCAALNSPVSLVEVAAQDLVEWEQVFECQKRAVTPVLRVAPPRPVSPTGKTPFEAITRLRNERDGYVEPKPVVASGARPDWMLSSADSSRAASPVRGEECVRTLRNVTPDVAAPAVQVRRALEGLRIAELPVVQEPTPVETEPPVQLDAERLVPSAVHSRGGSVSSSVSDAYESSSSMTEELPPRVQQSDTLGVLEGLIGRIVGEVEARGHSGLVPGKYVYYPGLEHVGSTRGLFPEGFDSLERVLTALGSDVAVRNWAPARRLAATLVAVDTYNDCLVQVKALSAVVNSYKVNFADVSDFVDVSVVYKWMAGIAETAVEVETRMLSCMRILELLQERGYQVIPDQVARETEVGKRYLSALESVAALRSDTNPGLYERAWADRPLPGARMAALDAVAHHEAEARRTRRMITQGAVVSGSPPGGGSGSRSSVSVWIKPQGPAYAGGPVGRGLRERLARTVAGL